jgi:hypothetical protein
MCKVLDAGTILLHDFFVERRRRRPPRRPAIDDMILTVAEWICVRVCVCVYVCACVCVYDVSNGFPFPL